MTPDAPSNARAAITLPIMVFHLLYHSSPVPDAAIITHATMIAINDARRITVTSILVNQSIRRGKAVDFVTCKVLGSVLVFRLLAAFNAASSCFEIISIQLPMKGTVVLSLMPQQTHGPGTQIHSPLIFCFGAVQAIGFVVVAGGGVTGGGVTGVFLQIWHERPVWLPTHGVSVCHVWTNHASQGQPVSHSIRIVCLSGFSHV